MIQFIKPGILIDFVSKFKVAIAISLILIVIGMGHLIWKGPKLGIEFKGGTSIQLEFEKPVNVVDLRGAIKNSRFFADSRIQSIGGSSKRYIVYTKVSTSSTTESIESKLKSLLDAKFKGSYKILEVDMVGPKVGKEFRDKGLIAIALSLIAILVYISIRFQYRFAVGAILALLHDVLITVGFLSIFGYEFTLDVVAAILTIVGYSVNDTIVIFDRIREKVKTNRNLSNVEAINRGVSETLSRTILTAGTTLFVVLSLYLFGGHALKGMSFALLVGIISGTYSSIFIASPVLLMFKGALIPQKKEVDSTDKFKQKVEFDMKM
ncbi:protein translocase subunit SecF [Hippea maritima]|uniref:Protein-export membrane protein SecF n=1 Tax=Hippea maritima (strain ATCC 700847 / DSM 10411 / MH2) TaxID=760142 RepID=F2LVG0_HIPMA|nr:protein translocase subunit SecF [Hippea maritima]AEA33744.1 protein-export membrane protein SecF [Hippea maritima DSM 10411]